MSEIKVSNALQRNIDIINESTKWYFDAGKALREIRDKQQYLETHKTFEAFCKENWGFSDRHARRLMESSEVVERIVDNSGPIGPVGSKNSEKSTVIVPTNEGQARAVADCSDDPKTQAKVWAAAVESAPKDADGKPKVTASIVKKAAESIAPKKPKPEPEPPKEDARLSFDTAEMEAESKGLKDSLGHEITNGCENIFRHVTTFTSLIQQLGKLLGEIEKLAMTDAGNHLNYEDQKTLVRQLQTNLRFAKPYCPCPPIERAKDVDQRKRWEGVRYLVEMEYRQLTDKQKAGLK